MTKYRACIEASEEAEKKMGLLRRVMANRKVDLMAHNKGCGHGKSFKDRCIDCELVLAQSGLQWAKENLARYGRQIAELEAERQQHVPTENSKPFVEFGTGWAKVHFRREVTDQDRELLTAVAT